MSASFSMLRMKWHGQQSRVGGIVPLGRMGRGFDGWQRPYPHERKNIVSIVRHRELYNRVKIFSDSSPRDSEDSGSSKPEQSAEASTIGQQIMSILKSPGDFKGQDSVIQYLPDAVIDKYLEKYENGAPGSMRKNRIELESDDDVCLQEFIKQSEEMLANSYTWRGLLFNAPKSVAMLSTLVVDRNRVLQRFHVESFSGEMMVINLELRLQKTLQATYRGLSVVEQWFLHGLKGEALSDEYPKCPTPTVGPERVVECQLNGLRNRSTAHVWAFASPQNKSHFQFDMHAFNEMLKSPQYEPLLSLDEWEVLKSVQLTPEKSMVVVGISSHGSKYAYMWICGLQGPDGLHESGNKGLVNAWMCDAVHCLNA